MKQTAIDFSGPFAFDPSVMAVAPSEHRDAKETSALAAIENAQTSRKAVQNTRILSLIKAAGEQGISDIELQRATGYPRSSICARRGFDLKTLITAAGRYRDENTKRSYCRWRLRKEGE
jgi:hypothetical protein